MRSRVPRKIWLLLFFLFMTNYDVFVTRSVLYTIAGLDNLIQFDRFTTIHAEVERIENASFPIKGDGYENMLESFIHYRNCNPASPDTVMYRTFQMRPLQFWNWLNFFTHPRWRHPYINAYLVQHYLNPLPPTHCPDQYPDRPSIE